MRRFNSIHSRIIVGLLLENNSAINTCRFKYNDYLGDPVNIVRIYNEKMVDELMVVDKSAAQNGINFELLADIAATARFPLAYCGNIRTLQDARMVVKLGFEKVFLNSTYTPELAVEISGVLGSSCLGLCVDIKKSLFGSYGRFHHRDGKIEKVSIIDFVLSAVQVGVGEFCLRYVDRDGDSNGYDTSHLAELSSRVPCPTIIAGGARDLNDFKSALANGASACMASTMFSFYGQEKGILPNYPKFDLLEEVLNSDGGL